MNMTKKVGAAFLIAVVAFLAFFFLNKYNSGGNKTTSVALGERKDAPAGQLAEGFPKELALEQNAKVAGSFEIPYQSFNQYTGTFTTDKSITQVYNEYMKYLTDNGYQLLSKETKSNFAHLYAIKAGSDVNVTIAPSGKSTSITVTYLAK